MMVIYQLKNTHIIFIFIFIYLFIYLTMIPHMWSLNTCDKDTQWGQEELG